MSITKKEKRAIKDYIDREKKETREETVSVMQNRLAELKEENENLITLYADLGADMVALRKKSEDAASEMDSICAEIADGFNKVVIAADLNPAIEKAVTKCLPQDIVLSNASFCDLGNQLNQIETYLDDHNYRYESARCAACKWIKIYADDGKYLATIGYGIWFPTKCNKRNRLSVSIKGDGAVPEGATKDEVLARLERDGRFSKKDNFSKVRHALQDMLAEEWLPDDPDAVPYGKLPSDGKAEAADVDILAAECDITKDAMPYLYQSFMDSDYGKEGVWRYGYKVTFDPETHKVMVEDAARAVLQISDERNRPIAMIRETEDGSPTCRLEADQVCSWLRDHGIQEDEVRVDPDSIDRFYSYGRGGSKDFVRQVESTKKARLNDPSVDFWRTDINKIGDIGWYKGSDLFEHDCLVQDQYGFYLDEDVTADDVQMILEGYPEDGWAAKEVRRMYEARNDASALDKAREEYSRMHDAVQHVIDEHAEEICAHMLKCLGFDPEDEDAEDPDFQNALHKAEQRFGFDCGDIMIAPKEERYRDYVKTAALDPETRWAMYDGSFMVNWPYSTQSCTCQRYEFDAAKPYLEAGLGMEFIPVRSLD